MNQSAPELSTVAALIVTYNRKGLLAKCLDAVLSQSRALDAVLVIDNASTDGTGELIETRYAGLVTYHRLPENLGGSGGFHKGMALAYHSGHDYIWIMDDDVVPEPDCLRHLLTCSALSRAVAPLRLSPEGSIVDFAPTILPQTGRTKRRGRGPSVHDFCRGLESLPPTIEVDYFTFEGPLFHRSVVAAVGLPRADFFITDDAVEYSWRTANAGLGPLLYVTSARVNRMLPLLQHPLPAWRYYYMSRNYFVAFRAQVRPRWKAPLADVRMVAWCLKQILGGRASREHLKPRFRAWLDSFRRPLPRRTLPFR